MDKVTRETAKATRQNEFVGYLKAAVARGADNLPGARLLPLDRIDPNPYQPRTRPLADADAAELDASLRAHGILQPIAVRPVGDRYQIVDGEQRWRAARRVGLTTVPSVERQVSDEDMELLALLANTQRNDLAPLDEARAYKRLMVQRRLSLREMAGVVHKSHEHVAQRLRLLDNPDITAAVDDGWFTPTVALSVDRVTDPARRAALLDRHRPEGPPTLADARAARQADEGDSAQQAPSVKYLTEPVDTAPSSPPSAVDMPNAAASVKYLTPPRADRGAVPPGGASSATTDTRLGSTDDAEGEPWEANLAHDQHTPPVAWVHSEDTRTGALFHAGSGRAEREQLRVALLADLEALFD